MMHDPGTDGSKASGKRPALGIAFLLKDSAIYGIANGLAKAVGLITLPLLASHLSVAAFGRVDYFFVVQSLLTVTLIMGFDSAMARFFYDTENLDARRQVIVQSLIAQLILATFGVSLLATFARNGLPGMETNHESMAMYTVILAQAPLMILINCAVGVLKWTFRRTEFLIMTLGYTVVQALAWLFVLGILNAGPVGVLQASLATSVIFALGGLFMIRGWLAWPSDLARARAMLPFAWPVGVVCILAALSPAVERSLTNSLLGPDALGLYAAAAKIALIMMLLVNAFQTAWGPFSLSIFEHADAPEVFDRVLRGFAALSLAFALGIAAVAPFLLRWLAGPPYTAAAVVVLPLALATAVQAIGWILEIGITISKRSHLNLWAYLVYCVATASAILLLGPKYGLAGVAWAVLAGQLARTLISASFAQFAYPLRWRYGTVIGQLLLALGLAGLMLWLGSAHGEVAFIMAGVLGSICLILVAILRSFSNIERALARSWISSIISKTAPAN